MSVIAACTVRLALYISQHVHDDTNFFFIFVATQRGVKEKNSRCASVDVYASCACGYLYCADCTHVTVLFYLGPPRLVTPFFCTRMYVTRVLCCTQTHANIFYVYVDKQTGIHLLLATDHDMYKFYVYVYIICTHVCIYTHSYLHVCIQTA